MSDKWLFTPGPLTTSATVKQAMLHDLGSRDQAFIDAVKFIRAELLRIAGLNAGDGYEAVLMQGSGTFGVESVVSSAIPAHGKLMVIVNGAYGERLVKMAEVHGIDCTALQYGEDEIPDTAEVEVLLKSGGYTHLAMIHSETTSGIFNALEPFGKLAATHGCTFIVDAMSSFGAAEIDFQQCCIDFLISSSNKCIEGVPGFSFVLCRKAALESCKGNARTLSLDLYAQWIGLEQNGQFRFTPPTHSLLAFARALQELEEEGGVPARMKRYQENNRILLEGMKALGFESYLSPEVQGYIINTFRYPAAPTFRFAAFYEALNEKGYVIYPGKLTKADCFRIGNIGQLFPEHIRGLLQAIAEVKQQMGF